MHRILDRRDHKNLLVPKGTELVRGNDSVVVSAMTMLEEPGAIWKDAKTGEVRVCVQQVKAGGKDRPVTILSDAVPRR